jgi:hypothetical protein
VRDDRWQQHCIATQASIDLIETKSPELNQKRFSAEDCGCVPHHPLKNRTPSALCSLLAPRSSLLSATESTYYLVLYTGLTDLVSEGSPAGERTVLLYCTL